MQTQQSSPTSSSSSSPSSSSSFSSTTPPRPTSPPSPQRKAPASSGSSSTGPQRKRAASSPLAHVHPDSEDAQVAIKRRRNTMAARKYRQKRLDRVSHLEDALASVTGERDHLKLPLARREAQVEALREMLLRK
ncbi:hypothetical protein UVI_02051750 [Ustilaginoidea virens]|uniref:BZIP domain-containing protein n=1 Tax=Ustilaginoidea virens TaxID=1159556 RepID=A0A1B5L0B8_USTVR|nr:hypothetical protein UVI_02051750 [Ustilaginoidea virens]